MSIYSQVSIKHKMNIPLTPEKYNYTLSVTVYDTCNNHSMTIYIYNMVILVDLVNTSV